LIHAIRTGQATVTEHPLGKFDIRKIGTGEGAQAYGHGLYFAENPAVAEEYRSQLAAGVTQRVAGEPYNSNKPEHLAASLLNTFSKVSKDPRATAMKELASDIANPALTPAARQRYQATFDLLKSGAELPALTREKAGRTYHVSIKADPDQFLDWDKPLSQQSPKVQESIRRMIDANPLPTYPSEYSETNILRKKLEDGSITGGEAYQLASKAVGKPSPILSHVNLPSKEAASETMRQAGIPGIKYLDQGSRQAVPLFDGKPLRSVTPTNAVEARALDALNRTTSVDEAVQYLKQDAGTESAQAWLTANAHRVQQPSGTSNYVVFDDKLIDILKKYAVAGAVGGSLASLGQQHTEEQK
jgi:hypothetical protein